ncbi:hypothetical protein GALMADRAFT_434698 [Galerina marginata CBS 339.88]|uniref:Hemerythrin-like domain-containing protein n=1 Tax=Galerina marginata (strain CBS 339.88) TaxID=685588 RepID=A0A067TB99_GALM3|nr:hypothetical protein GALMADRAFT_434698 [Galerina marginata CBS 339.88]
METAPWSIIPILNAPIEFDPTAPIADWFGLEMTMAHNVIIRGIISIWRHAPVIHPADEKAFAGYALSCLELIHAHHHGEEAVIFPRLQVKLDHDMSHNVEQHQAFQEEMEALEEYLKKVHNGEAEYDGEGTRRLLKAFADPLIEHLNEELTTITPEKLSVFTNDELAEMSKALEDHIKTVGGFFTLFPFTLTNHDKRDSPKWPPAPTHIKWFAITVGYFFNRSYWKFSTFTRTGELQTYEPESI